MLTIVVEVCCTVHCTLVNRERTTAPVALHGGIAGIRMNNKSQVSTMLLLLLLLLYYIYEAH